MRYPLVLLLSLAVFGGMPGIARASHEIPFSPEERARLGISVAEVTPAESTTSERLPAQVRIPPNQLQIVSAPLRGLVSKLEAATEQHVKAGEPLAVLLSPDLVTQQRDFLHALSTYRVAAKALERDRTLAREGIIPKRRLQETLAGEQQARTTLEANRAALELAGMSKPAIARLEQNSRLSNQLTVDSPMAGVILEQLVAVGERVEQAQPLYRLARIDPLWLDIRVPIERLTGVTPGAEVMLSCSQQSARVTMVGHTVDPDSQTVLVRAVVKPQEGCIRPGQFTEVRIKLPTPEVSYRIPTSAVVHVGPTTLVFVDSPAGFIPTPVQVTGHEGDYDIVRGELADAKTVAVSGLAAIKAAWQGKGP